MARSLFTDTDRKYAYNGRLGVRLRKSATEFAVWSPYAESVELLLYRSGSDGGPFARHSMAINSDGVWKLKLPESLEGAYYTYKITHKGFAVETSDIYSESTGANGRRTLIFSHGRTSPEGWENDKFVSLASPADAVICELHVRDFSMDKSASFVNRGKLSALYEGGVKNQSGDTVGLDYIQSLGVTHIQLMPIMDYASVDENNPTYNWGYDPLHFTSPEGSYSDNPEDGKSRVIELKRLVQEVHSRGMGVVLDVVYNHTFSAEDSPLGRTFPHYYYRRSGENYSNGSGCGNEIASERRMARRLIIDSLCSLAKNYHIDGFRFDLMGLMDITTLKRCERKLRKINPDILLYGEGWTGGASPLSEKRRAVKKNISKLSGFAAFSDDFRDGLKGSVFEDKDCGYINGSADDSRRELIKSVLLGGVYHEKVNRPQEQCWAKLPINSINYVECHDNLTFHDKLKLTMEGADRAELLRVERLGAALVFLSQGIPFFQCGQEFLRSKPVDSGYNHNSYNASDEINCIKWQQLSDNKQLSDYCRGLIEIRKSYPQLRASTAKELAGASFKNLPGGGFMATLGDFRLIVNPDKKPAALRLTGNYEVLADGETASAKAVRQVSGKTVCGAQSILLLKSIPEAKPVKNIKKNKGAKNGKKQQKINA